MVAPEAVLGADRRPQRRRPEAQLAQRGVEPGGVAAQGRARAGPGPAPRARREPGSRRRRSRERRARRRARARDVRARGSPRGTRDLPRCRDSAARRPGAPPARPAAPAARERARPRRGRAAGSASARAPGIRSNQVHARAGSRRWNARPASYASLGRLRAGPGPGEGVGGAGEVSARAGEVQAQRAQRLGIARRLRGERAQRGDRFGLAGRIAQPRARLEGRAAHPRQRRAVLAQEPLELVREQEGRAVARAREQRLRHGGRVDLPARRRQHRACRARAGARARAKSSVSPCSRRGTRVSTKALSSVLAAPGASDAKAAAGPSKYESRSATPRIPKSARRSASGGAARRSASARQIRAQRTPTADQQQIVAVSALARVDQLAAREDALEARDHGEQRLRVHREAVDPEREAAAVREPGAHQPEELLGEQVRRARLATDGSAARRSRRSGGASLAAPTSRWCRPSSRIRRTRGSSSGFARPR